jgi:uncharacterized protein (DUF924 family)
MITPDDILSFWYSPQMQPHWFASTPQIDAMLRENYAALWQDALQNKLDDWMDSPQGALALVIILDQFPLNMFRGLPQSFASEAKAIAVAKHAISKGYDRFIDTSQLAFLYMPLMHSEDLADQDRAVRLYAAAGLDNNLQFAQHHRAIVARFGRFPHRNAILGRASTAAERDYLNSNDAFKG